MARRQPIVSGLDPDIKNLLSLHRQVVEASLARQQSTMQWTSAARHTAASRRERDARRAFNHALRDMQAARKPKAAQPAVSEERLLSAFATLVEEHGFSESEAGVAEVAWRAASALRANLP